jgi:pimeloyl-ACP methyl ester carboxylesterase
VPFYFTEDLHAAIPGAQKCVIQEGGHYSYRRHPGEWNKQVDAFLADAENRI